MRINNNQMLERTHASRRAFTLLELLLATAIFAIVIIAINVVFFSALHLRNRVTATLDEAVPLQQALVTLRKDLQNTVSPGGVLAGHFRYGSSGLGSSSSSSSSSSSTASGSRAFGAASTGSGSSVSNLTQSVAGGLDFFTSTGVIRDYSPGADIQEVNYQLTEAVNASEALGQDLVRTVTRNLLAFSSPVPEQQRLLSNVESLEFEFYDGYQWRNNWDTSLGDTTLPMAVRVKLLMAIDRTNNVVKREPLEMVVLLNSKPDTTSTNSTGTTVGGML